MGASVVGLQARLMSQAMRKLTGIISKTRTVAVFINQLREKIGVAYGNPETTTGGRALKFYASVRIDVRRADSIKQGTESLGNRTRAKIVKNKVAPPFKTAEFDIIYGEGVSRLGSIIDMAVELDIVNKSGAWYSYEGTRLGQGKENAKATLEEQPELIAELEEKIRTKILVEGEKPKKKSSKKAAAAAEQDAADAPEQDVPEQDAMPETDE